MPKVTQHKKSRGGKTLEYRCQQCSSPIVPGETYYEWSSFRYGGTHRQHTSHGMPRSSQLTQSKMGAVYSAAEALESWSPSVDEAAYGEGDVHTPENRQDRLTVLEEVINDAQSAIQDAKDQAQEVADEYQEAIDNMPASEEQNQERIDYIDEWINGALDDADSNIQNIDLEQEVDEDAEDNIVSLSSVIEQVQSYLGDAAGEFQG